MNEGKRKRWKDGNWKDDGIGMRLRDERMKWNGNVERDGNGDGRRDVGEDGELESGENGWNEIDEGEDGKDEKSDEQREEGEDPIPVEISPAIHI